MNSYPFLFINSTLIVGCLAMAFVFLTLPLSENIALKKYKLSLKFLALGYFLLSFFKVLLIVLDYSLINILSAERIAISSLQATIFTVALIVLINPRFVTSRYLIRQLFPVFGFLVFYIICRTVWGNVIINTFDGFGQFMFHPCMVVRELFAMYYVFQLIYLSLLFYRQVRLFEWDLKNYYSECSSKCLPWIKFCYSAVLTVGIGTLVSCFVMTNAWVFGFLVFCTIFYLFFGIYYIQYPRKFVYLEPAITFVGVKEEVKTLSNKKRLDWSELKKQIIADKYYLQQGVNIEDMARYLKIGRTTLSTFINNEEKVNFNMWINLLRVQEAQKLLQTQPELTLTQVSEIVGYSELSNFSRQFKLLTKTSPTEWRQTARSATDTLR